jgi:hypothetical protein
VLELNIIVKQKIMKKNILFGVLFAIIVVGGVVYAVYKNADNSSTKDSSKLEYAWNINEGENGQEKENTNKGYNAENNSQIVPATNPQESNQETSERYENDKYGFSFIKNTDFNVTSFPENGGDMFLINGSKEKTFQIFVLPFDETTEEYAMHGGTLHTTITPERILRDLPQMKIEDPKEIEINGIPALLFWSEEESIGKTREVWMVHPSEPYLYGNYLYQVVADAENDSYLSNLMGTFKME